MAIKIVKFGGTSIGTPARLRRASRGIQKLIKRGHSPVVVVSAMGSSTDTTLDLIRSLKVELSDRAVDEILSVGERLSARVMYGILESLGVDSTFLDPAMENWPVITDDNFGNAEVSLMETRKRCQEYLLPIVKRGCVPVICGFLGRSFDGKVTTMGRGASDQTAFLLGYCLEAEEVIIVTDVSGVMSADPRLVSNARLLNSIYIEELWDLSVGGARVMNSGALRYKLEGQTARIVNYRKKNLDSGGTVIMGSASSGLEVMLYDKPVSAITIVGEEMSGIPGLLSKFSEALTRRKINILNVGTGRWSITLFVDHEYANDAVSALHDLVGPGGPAKAVTKSKGCAMITITGRKLISTPGIVSEALQPLGENDVNVVEVSTSKAEITIFVNWVDRRLGMRLVKGAIARMDIDG
jgi:aspartate kinase